MSGGRTITSLPSTVVRLETDDGVVGCGETCPLGLDLPARVRGRRAGGAARARARADRRRPAQSERGLGRDGRRARAATPTPRRRSTSRAGTCSAGRWACRSRRCSAACARADFPLYVAIPLGPVDDDGRARARRARARASGASSSSSAPTRARTRRACARCWTRPRTDEIDHRRRQRRLAPAGRDDRRARARGPRPRALRAAVPDARGVPDRARAHDAADGARRGHHRRATRCCAPAARWRRQPQDRPRRRAHARRKLMRDLGSRARPAVHDRGQLGRRPHDRRGRPPRGDARRPTRC